MEDLERFNILVEDAMRKVEKSLSLPFVVRCKSPVSAPPQALCIMFFRSKDDVATAPRRRAEIETALHAELKQNGFCAGTKMDPQVNLHLDVLGNP